MVTAGDHRGGAYDDAFCDSQEWLERPQTVGKAIFGELQILDDDENPVPPGVIGTVWFAGVTSFAYYHDPVKTAEGRDLAAHRSTVGDIGYLGDEGYLFVTNRKTEIIISGGLDIYPQEVENLLITYPDVGDVPVFGVPNHDLGEEVKAVVQPADTAQPGPELEKELI